MKPSIAIWLVAAFADAAWAQAAATQPPANATVFGVLDVGYQYLKSGDNSPLGGQTLHRLADGHTYGPGSRLGFLAQESLGNGLQAKALIEMGFSADTGALAQGGRAFGRQAYVSLSESKLGEIRLGRQYALHDEVQAVNNPFGNTTVLNPGASSTFNIGAVPLFIDAPRLDNTLQYRSPSMYGLTVQASVALGEGLVDRYQGIKGAYADGPLTVAASYEWSKARVGTIGVSQAGDAVNKVLEASANYDFGTFRLFGGYQSGRDLTPGGAGIVTGPSAAGGVGTQIASLALPGLSGPATQLNAYTVGASMPVGRATIGANYTRAQYKAAAGDNRTLGRIGAAATYPFSKSALVYTGLATHNGDLKDFVNEKLVFQLGLRKTF